MGLGRKSLCKAPESSVLKGLLYAGIKRVRVSWPEVGTQFTAQFRDHSFGDRAAIALDLAQLCSLSTQARTLEQRGHS